MNIRALSYAGIEVTDLAAWEQFATEFLGMPSTHEGDDRLLLRMDERAYRFDLRRGAADRLAWLGWEVSTRADLAAAVDELRAAGVEVAAGSADEAKERGVIEFAVFHDPAGTRNELFYGQQADFRAAHALFNHHRFTSVAKLAGNHHLAQGHFGFGRISREQHALARRQTRRLDHHGVANAVQVFDGFVKLGKGSKLRRRDVVSRHKLLGKGLG